jgi:Rrf2 family transcriptional regulator, iron-sulfur cluster assembly transcription factor
MLLSRASQYTLQALIFLARQPPGQRVMIKDIAEALDLPVFYLGKLIQAPARIGWLGTARGRGGGVYLAANAESIHLFEVLQLTDGQRIKRECLLGLKDCDDATACVMHCDWKPEVHHVHAGGGHVVHVQEFAHRRAGAPDGHHARALLTLASWKRRISAGMTWLFSGW